jgi:hypothetical protein
LEKAAESKEKELEQLRGQLQQFNAAHSSSSDEAANHRLENQQLVATTGDMPKRKAKRMRNKKN